VWTSEVVQSLNDPTIANVDVYRPQGGERAGDDDEVDEAYN